MSRLVISQMAISKSICGNLNNLYFFRMRARQLRFYSLPLLSSPFPFSFLSRSRFVFFPLHEEMLQNPETDEHTRTV